MSFKNKTNVLMLLDYYNFGSFFKHVSIFYYLFKSYEAKLKQIEKIKLIDLKIKQIYIDSSLSFEKNVLQKFQNIFSRNFSILVLIPY